MNNQVLYQKYNVPTPRYTSYPTVPHWEESTICKEKWRMKVRDSFREFNKEHGVSVYIHLPYCESLCTYCGCNTRITVNHGVEEPYINALLKEFGFYLKEFGEKPNLKELHLGGGTPTFFSPKNLKRLISRILSEVELAEDAELSFEAHPANTTFEHLMVLRSLGFRRLSLGIQDFDPKIQKVINRKQSVEDVQRVVENARALGYSSINFDIIYGLPFQTLDSVKDTIEKVLGFAPERIAYYSYAHVPWKHKGQRAYDEKDLPDDEYKRNLYDWGKQLLLDEGYQEIGMDHFALTSDALFKAKMNKGLHRNFMGYTPMVSKFLIGLGVSAISDVHYGYAQNKKVVEDYIESVESGKLAIFKGHFMTDKDIATKELINEFMCNEEVSMTLLNDLDSETQKKIGDKLSVFESEGLIRVNGAIELLPQGKKFIRNVAAGFDYRLLGNPQSKAKFSKSI